MGQIAVKLKEFFFKLKTSNETTISEASVEKEKGREKEEINASDSSQSAHETKEKLDKPKDGESHAEIKTESGGKDESCSERYLSIKDYRKQMVVLEKVVDEQRKIIEEHGHKLATMEKILQRRLPQENAALPDNDHKEEQEKLEGNFVDQNFVLEQKQLQSTSREVQEQQEMIGEQARSLKEHEVKLETQQTKIEIIREMLEEDKGVYCRGKQMKEQLDKQNKRLNKQESSLENIQTQFREDLKTQQSQLDILLAGFFVAFFIIVIIIMLPKF